MHPLPHRIAEQARTWVGTRFHHQGRLKKTDRHAGGVDCLGLLIGVARELDLRGRNGALLAQLDKTDYGHLPDGVALATMLRVHLDEVFILRTAKHLSIAMGDVLLLAPDGVARHLGIVGENTLIHAYAQARRVTEHALDEYWRGCIRGVFRVPVQ